MPDAATPHDVPSRERLLELKDVVVPRARELGRWAAALSARHRAGEDVLAVATKSGPGDVVTVADDEVQRQLVETLRGALPGAGFLGEEGLREGAGDAPTWVIDPIDGTHNFVRGYPGFCVSVGLVVDDVSVLGVIYDALDDAVFWAVRGEGAWRDDVRLRPRLATDPAEAVVATNLYAAVARLPAVERTFMALAREASGVRASGSACRDFCLFAQGSIDLFWQAALNPWDVAAGAALVREAGGEVAFHEGSEGWTRTTTLTVFAGAPELVRHALRLWDGSHRLTTG